jgi:hypothetical protein
VWIPAFIDREGRDSLGRGQDAESIAAAVARDGRMARAAAAVRAGEQALSLRSVVNGRELGHDFVGLLGVA